MQVEKFGIPLLSNPDYASWLQATYTFAKTSQHPSTHNAAALVRDGKIVLIGVNNLPPGVESVPLRFEGPNKHIFPNHAERDAIYKAARAGISTEGLTMVMPWLPCIPCANAIITAGIERLIVHKQMVVRTEESWQEELSSAVQLLREAKVHLEAYDGVVGAKAYMHKQFWDA